MRACSLPRKLSSLIVVALAALGCGELVMVETSRDDTEPYGKETYAPRNCDAPVSCVLARCDTACSPGPTLDATTSCACCSSGPAPSDVKAAVDLRVHGSDLDIINGRAVFAA